MNDLKHSGRQLRVMDRNIGIARGKNARILRGRPHFDHDGRLKKTRLEIGGDRRCDYDQEKGQNDQDPPDANNTPIV